MKKILSFVLALVMILSLSTVVFAADGDTTTTPTYTDMETVTITKWYNNRNNGVSPAETLEFNHTKVGVTNAGVIDAETGAVVTIDTMPDLVSVASISFDEGDAGKVINDGDKRDIVVTLPKYEAVGIYTYTINEVAGTMAGVTYHTADIKLVVTVIEQDGKVRVAAVHTEESGDKKDTFTNVYESGSLSVNKQVTGNLGDLDKNFTVTVTFTAPEGETVGAPIYYTDNGQEMTIAANWEDTTSVNIDLKHDETVTFTNIPEGVTYTVIEDDYTGDGYDEAVYEYSDDAKLVDTDIDGENKDSVVITNNKEAEVDTGIALDSMPYIMILAVVAGAFVLTSFKKREV